MMAETVTLRLIFYGLIAFAPEPGGGQPEKLHALLVDATGPQFSSDGCAIPRHEPVLYARAARCWDNGRPCTFAPDVERPIDVVSGGWRLDGQLLGVEVLPATGRRTRQLIAAREEDAPGVLPSSRQESESLAWIPSVEGLAVSRDCLGEAKDCPIISRVTLDDGRVTSCHLAVTPELFELYPYELKPLVQAAAPQSRQAMSDVVMVSLEIPRDARVRITSRPLRAGNGARGRVRKIVLQPGRRNTIDVWITNVPSHHEPGTDFPACHHTASDIDRHFELFYNLANRPVPYPERFVPHRVRDTTPRGDGGSALCPLLSFEDDKRIAADIDCDPFGEDCRIPNDWKSCVGYWYEGPTP